MALSNAKEESQIIPRSPRDPTKSFVPMVSLCLGIIAKNCSGLDGSSMVTWLLFALERRLSGLGTAGGESFSGV